MISAVIFDCFGVFYIDPVISYMHDPSSPKDRAAALHELDEQAARGHLTKQQFIDQAAELLRLPAAEIQHQFFQGEVRNQPLIDYAQNLRANYKVALLSNLGSDMMDGFFSAADRMDLFDDVVLSGDVGLAKPDRKIFEVTCSRLGILPHEAVMIDDIESNVAGARTAGLASIHYQNFAQCRAELEALLQN